MGVKSDHSDNPSSPVSPVMADPNHQAPTAPPPPPSSTLSQAQVPGQVQTPSVPGATMSFEEMRIRPQLLAAFTCTHCDTRSTRRISRQAYTEGVVLARCSGCQQLHLLADHLKWFSDSRETIEDIMREKGVVVVKRSLTSEERVAAGESVITEDSELGPRELPSGLHWRDHDGVVEVTK